MALLDVSDILDDPDFADSSFVCHRLSETVDGHGRAQVAPQDFSFTGVATSNAGDMLKRLPEGSRIEGSITIHTKFPLRAAGQNYAADEITWKGRDYIVSTINDYTSYGAGFVAANCILKPLAG